MTEAFICGALLVHATLRYLVPSARIVNPIIPQTINDH